MKAMQIELKCAEDISDFVKIVQKYPFDIGLRCNGYVVDAKSILGIFSLCPSPVFNVEIHSKNADELIKELYPFMKN